MAFVPTGTFSGEAFEENASEHFPLDLNKKLIQHPVATYLMRVGTGNLQKFGVQEHDILIIDRAITPTLDSLVVYFADDIFTISPTHLLPANTQTWGVVTYVIRNMRNS